MNHQQQQLVASIGDVYETSDHNDNNNNNNVCLNNNMMSVLNDENGIGVTSTNNDQHQQQEHLQEQEEQQQERTGTISSARFNILSTMVGGGCLSLPLAFQKSGNGCVGPILLLLTGAITEYVFRILIESARIVHRYNNNNNNISRTNTSTEDGTTTTTNLDNNTDNDNEIEQKDVGTDSFESIAEVAFGPYMRTFCTGLVLFMCFFGTVAYAVLLRDMLLPINNYIVHQFFIPNNTTNTTSMTTTTTTTNMNPFIFYSNQGNDISLSLYHSEPNDILLQQSSNDHQSLWENNISMWIIILLITPACAIQSFTSLQQFGAFGMLFVLILGCCIFYRSGQCLYDTPNQYLYDAIQIQLLPDHWSDVLDVLPLFISVYACHYNILPVHNEFYKPTNQRVIHWLSSTVWIGTAFYMCMGLAGSIYGTCSAAQKERQGNNTTWTVDTNIIIDNDNDNDVHATVSGNILLDFPSDDPLLLVGRMCLAVTITLAFPILIIPARDIVLRSIVPSIKDWCCSKPLVTTTRQHVITTTRRRRRQQQYVINNPNEPNATLTQALLEDYNANDNEQQQQQQGTTAAAAVNRQYVNNSGHGGATGSDDESNWLLVDESDGLENTNNNNNTNTTTTVTASSSPFMTRLIAATFVLYVATALASCVNSIAIVWDLLGSSLSILLSYIIPAGSYLMIVYKYQRRDSDDGIITTTTTSRRWTVAVFRQHLSIIVAIVLLIVYIPLMFLSTANAVYNIFILHKQ